MCDGTAVVIDILGACCAGTLDAQGVCCTTALDRCGVCSGDGQSCAVAVTVSAASGLPGAPSPPASGSTDPLDPDYAA